MLLWRFVFVGVLFVTIFFLLSVFLTALKTSSAEAKANDPTDSQTIEVSDDPNAVTSGMIVAADRLGESLQSTTTTVGESAQSVASTTVRGGKSVAGYTGRAAVTTARGVGKGFAVTGRIIGKGVGAVFGVPGAAVRSVANTSVVRGIIRPSDHVEVPIIDPNSPELQAALVALPPAQPTPQPTAGPQWPIRGAITTQFGVSHWPYQRTHTGLDISDGNRSGTTHIKPFRPGRVIEAVRSYQGLGNHVIIDHGNGVTSVYGHLASISVQVGQEVALDTTIGLEGSTGVSTGTHLHFEIRVNGQAADPRQFISGQP
jgi:murein DD-endopeptidase MepM/ murein hydrolase activator NlpD